MERLPLLFMDSGSLISSIEVAIIKYSSVFKYFSEMTFPRETILNRLAYIALTLNILLNIWCNVDLVGGVILEDKQNVSRM
jgi:hypothetical protein